MFLGSSSSPHDSDPKLKKVWVKKADQIGLVAHTSLKVLDSYHWCLDSACFKHMSRDKSVFIALYYIKFINPALNLII